MMNTAKWSFYVGWAAITFGGIGFSLALHLLAAQSSIGTILWVCLNSILIVTAGVVLIRNNQAVRDE